MQWQALHGDDQSAHASGDPSGMTAYQLGSVRIALLRHDRATRRIGIGQRHEPEGLDGPNDEFFRQSRKVQTALRSGHKIQSEERRVGKRGEHTSRSRRWPYY